MWKEYSIRLKYKETVFNIKIVNNNGKNTKIDKILLNGQQIDDKKIKLNNDNNINEIEIFL